MNIKQYSQKPIGTDTQIKHGCKGRIEYTYRESTRHTKLREYKEQ